MGRTRKASKKVYLKQFARDGWETGHPMDSEATGIITGNVSIIAVKDFIHNNSKVRKVLEVFTLL